MVAKKKSDAAIAKSKKELEAVQKQLLLLDPNSVALFRFDETKLHAKIGVDPAGIINDVDFLESPPNPVTLTTRISKPWPSKLGGKPTKAELYLAFYHPDQQPLFMLLNPENIEFVKSGDDYIAHVQFDQLHPKLSKAIIAKKMSPPEELIIRGYLRFTFDDGNKRLSGAMGRRRCARSPRSSARERSRSTSN